MIPSHVHEGRRSHPHQHAPTPLSGPHPLDAFLAEQFVGMALNIDCRDIPEDDGDAGSICASHDQFIVLRIIRPEFTRFSLCNHRISNYPNHRFILGCRLCSYELKGSGRNRRDYRHRSLLRRRMVHPGRRLRRRVRSLPGPEIRPGGRRLLHRRDRYRGPRRGGL